MTEALTLDGFNRVVLIEDILILIFGIYIGGFIMTFLICDMLTKTKAIENSDFDKISFFRIVSKDGEKKYLINANKKNVFENMRIVLLIIFSPSFLSKGYVVKDEKRAKILVGFLLLIGVIISIMTILAILKVTTPPPIPPR